MTEIIRSQSQIADATTAQLVATYNALTGKSIKKFEMRSIAEARVRMAIMSAEDAAGHAGVPKDTKPVAATKDELHAKDELRAPSVEKIEPAPQAPTTPLRAKLQAAIDAQPKITPRPKKSDTPKEQHVARQVIMRVRATFAGTSKCNAGSIRAAVLAKIQERTVTQGGPTISVAELDKHFGHSTRGYLQKLLEKSHIEVVPEQQTIEGV